MKVYLYETVHRCESITDWETSQCSLALDSTQKVEGKYSIKMTSNAATASQMAYYKNMDWSKFGSVVLSVYHPGYTNEMGSLWLLSGPADYKVWNFDFAAEWTEVVIDLSSTPDIIVGTLDLANIYSVAVGEINSEDPGEDYYFDFIHGRSIDITSDIIHPLSFIEHAVRDCPKLEFMAKGTWIPSRDYTIEILDYYTSNGSTTADQIIFEGSVTDYELTFPRKIWCVSRAKSDLDEFRPNGAYNGDLDSNHIKTLIAECSYITEGTIDATVGNTDNTFKGDKTWRTILNDWADKHLKHWSLSPTGALSFNDADVDSGAVLHYHKGTYNFKNDTIGSAPSGWTDLSDADCTATVIASLDGHKKVLQLHDANAAGIAQIYRTVTQLADQTNEFWLTKNSIAANTDIVVILYEGATLVVQLKFADNDVFYFAGGTYNLIKAGFLVGNTLSHFKIVMDDTANTFDFYIDGTLEGSDLSYRNNTTTGIDKITIQTDLADIGYYGYVDAIGLSSDANYNVGDNLKGDPFQCWNVKPKKHVDTINWVVLLGALVAGAQIAAESKDQNSIDELGAKIYKDTYAFITVVAQLQIAANNLRTREQLLPLAINLWSYEANRGLIQASECVWFAQSKANPNVSPRQVIVNKVIYRFLSGHINLQTTDGISFVKNKGEALPQENSLLIQQNATAIAASGNCFIATGTYTGNGADNRQITGFGFDPKSIFLHNDQAQFHYVDDQMTVWKSNTHYAAASAVMTNMVKLITDGIEVNNGDGEDRANILNWVYTYTAWG